MSLQTLTEDAADQARALIKHISARLRRQKVQHIDVLLPFEHYDPDKSGQVGVQHARVALAELDCILSESAVREMAALMHQNEGTPWVWVNQYPVKAYIVDEDRGWVWSQIWNRTMILF